MILDMKFIKPIKNIEHSSKIPVNPKQDKLKETTYRYIIENCIKPRRKSLNVLGVKKGKTLYQSYYTLG